MPAAGSPPSKSEPAPLPAASPPPEPTSTDSLLRSKSYGTSPSAATPPRAVTPTDADLAARAMASSMGFTNPRCKVALSAAVRSNSGGAAVPSSPRQLVSSIEPTVMVPVLSVHRAVMAPKSSIALSRWTMTLCFAITCAPWARLIPTIAGSSCGVNPTASDSENSAESTIGRFSSRLTMRMMTTSTIMMRLSMSPKPVMPRSNPVGFGACFSDCWTRPNSVSRPVATTSAVPEPDATCVPEKTMFERAASAVPEAQTPADLTTGNASPVSVDWSSCRSEVASTTASAGMMSPTPTWMTSPGTTSPNGTSTTRPSRSTLAIRRMVPRSLSIEIWAPRSCAKSSSPDSSTIVRMMDASSQSPSTPEIKVAAMRMRTMGLENCRSSSRHTEVRPRGSTARA